MNKCLRTLLDLGEGYTIYVHNLGGFDGMLLLRPLAEITQNFTLILDNSKNFISLDLKGLNLHFRDSYRIFPSSLQFLSSMFNTTFKKGSFDFNNLNWDSIRNP